ncbi:MAG: hypothetical protein HOO95_07050 [Gallionella sp.]|nr:hypothetical protein [Gallionella sp.]
MSSSVQKILFWLAVLFLFFILISAIRLGLADYYGKSSHRTLQTWNLLEQFPAMAQIEAIERDLEMARFLANDNPDVHEDIARLSLLRAQSPNISVSEKLAQLQRAISAIRIAISLRPVSPYSWTILLLIKRERNEFDGEFRHALHRAVELGPWEPELLTALADVGLSAWPKLPAVEQAMIQQVFLRGMQRQSNLMQDVVQTHRYECATGVANDKQKAECQ